MNIKITYNWLLEYLDTDANAYEIGNFLSLCGPSVESVAKVDDDYVFDIEITTNRIDTASVFGIACECCAILPQFNKRALLKFNPLLKYKFPDISKTTKRLYLKIKDDDISQRIAAIVLSGVAIKPSPKQIQKRLSVCDFQPVNNVVDISNYMFIALGQPAHIFDYDKIGGGKMTVQKSRKGEKMTTLDGKSFDLPGGDIIIKDGKGQIIDLAGIMGGQNSQITEKTSNILLFVPHFNKHSIRKTSMTIGQRTPAASYYEKGLDPERIEASISYGIDLLTNMASATASSTIIDFYPAPFSPKFITINTDRIRGKIGIDIDDKTISLILNKLGFAVRRQKGSKMKIQIPSFRALDINIEEDITEEVARIYGYHRLPSIIQKTHVVAQPELQEKLFINKNKIRTILRGLGATESYNYSMISKSQIVDFDLRVSNHIRVTNPINSDNEFMRTTLEPSLLSNLGSNKGVQNNIYIYEIARIYQKIKNSLPGEREILAIISNTSFFDLKGLVETLFRTLHIKTLQFSANSKLIFLSDNIQAKITDNSNNKVGYIGKIKNKYLKKYQLSGEAFVCVIDILSLIAHIREWGAYRKPNRFARVHLDLTYTSDRSKMFQSIKETAFTNSSLLTDISLVGSYKNKVTLRFTFERFDKNITEGEAKKELEKIKKALDL